MIRLTDLNKLTTVLRCPECSGTLSAEAYFESLNASECLRCLGCAQRFKIADGIPRMLTYEMRRAFEAEDPAAERLEIATARSFGYEWSQFSEMYAEWADNFREYMKPHDPESLRGKRVLDAGCGNGRHAYYAGLHGAEVWAVDLGPAVEVARRNTMGLKSVHVVQADLNNLPFQKDYFDFIYSIGVLHHLADPEGALRRLIDCLKPGGEIQVYLYWNPERQIVKRMLLAAVNSVRAVTTRLPFGVTYALSYPAALIAFCAFVWPYRILRQVPGLKRFAEQIPMKQYARYPFRVCVNDQFDRFSAPIEKRYTRADVESCLNSAGLEAVTVLPNFGWNGSGRKPVCEPENPAVPRVLRCVESRG